MTAATAAVWVVGAVGVLTVVFLGVVIGVRAGLLAAIEHGIITVARQPVVAQTAREVAGAELVNALRESPPQVWAAASQRLLDAYARALDPYGIPLPDVRRR